MKGTRRIKWGFVLWMTGLIVALMAIFTLAIYMPVYLDADMSKAEIAELSNFTRMYLIISAASTAAVIGLQLFCRFEEDYSNWIMYGATH